MGGWVRWHSAVASRVCSVLFVGAIWVCFGQLHVSELLQEGNTAASQGGWAGGVRDTHCGVCCGWCSLPAHAQQTGSMGGVCGSGSRVWEGAGPGGWVGEVAQRSGIVCVQCVARGGAMWCVLCASAYVLLCVSDELSLCTGLQLCLAVAAGVCAG